MQHSVPLHVSECRQSSNLGGHDVLPDRTLVASVFPFGTRSCLVLTMWTRGGAGASCW